LTTYAALSIRDANPDEHRLQQASAAGVHRNDRNGCNAKQIRVWYDEHA
jgi:hypothetical protein